MIKFTKDLIIKTSFSFLINSNEKNNEIFQDDLPFCEAQMCVGDDEPEHCRDE